MSFNIKNKISKINGLLKLYNKSNTSPTSPTSPTSFYNQIKKRAKHLKKESNFNTLAKDYSNLLKDKKEELTKKM